MARRKSQFKCAGVLLATLASIVIAVGVGVLAVPSDARAQQSGALKQTDRELVAKLNKLTRRKGYKSFAIGIESCRNLGLRAIKDCEVFQAPYQDADKTTHAFNSFDEPGTRAVRIIIFKKKTPVSHTYLVGLDGKLQRATFRRLTNGKDVYTPVELEVAKPGFENELAYWRAKQAELEGELDRKD